MSCRHRFLGEYSSPRFGPLSLVEHEISRMDVKSAAAIRRVLHQCGAETLNSIIVGGGHKHFGRGRDGTERQGNRQSNCAGRCEVSTSLLTVKYGTNLRKQFPQV